LSGGQGAQGAQGAAAAGFSIGGQGAQGAQGLPGSSVGAQGAKGAQGAQGPQGPPSDRRYKNNITPIVESRKKSNYLEGVTFQWKKDIPHLTEYGKDYDYLIKNRSLGFIAQQVENIIPEVVGEDKYGYKNLLIDLLTAVGLASVKENQERIIKLNDKLEPLKNLIRG
jgi:hypothetical protein